MQEYQNLLKEHAEICKAVFALCQESLRSFFSQIKSTVQNQQPLYHCMQGANMSGVFGIATQMCVSGLTDRNTSLTTDDTYLYMYMSIQGRSCMMKIGTGENGSTAGRVYLKVDTNDQADVTWVYCKGKLYSKKLSDPFGTLNVHDPTTLTIEGQIKLCLNECFANPKLMESLNRNFPLLSDGESLYIVTT
jgi:other hect domain ubiquitin protein ligase E3